MKRILLPSLRTFTACLILSMAVLGIAAQESTTPWSQNVSPLPAPTGMVNDFAGVLDESVKSQIESRLRELKTKTSPPIEIAVAVVRTTGERPIFDYSLAVARGWGIGAKEGDNPSALLFVAVDDRKYFTQVSKDLEDELPDGLVGSLQRQYLVPEFRKGDYGKGIADTIDAYIRTIETRTSGGVAPPVAETEKRPRGGVSQTLSSGFCCLAVIVVLGLIILSNRGGRSGRGRGGGGWGGGGFGGGGGVLPWIIGSAIANASSSSSSDSSWGSSDSGWDSGGGGSDWGGFGGGGDFGGGGGGGDW